MTLCSSPALPEWTRRLIRGPHDPCPPPPWRPCAWDDLVQGVLASWLGTPYVLSQREKARGVDCLRFVAAFLEEMNGWDRWRQIDRLPPDTALHSPRRARGALRKVLRLYEPWERVQDGPWESGDIAVQHLAGAAPTHALVASARRGVWVHATGDGVRECAVTDLMRGTVKVYRFGRREDLWC